MKYLKENYKKHLIILGLLTLITLIIFSPYIFNVRPFLFSADQQLQYNYFYDEWKRMILGFITKRSLPFYSFDTYLGNNFYASKLYYLTGDILMPLVMLFKDVEVGLMWISLLIVILSGYNFSIFLRSFGLKRENAIIVGSCIYAFSGISSIYVGQYMFHRFYCFLPLLFASMEYYLRKGKLSPFVIMVTILSLTNYYFLFPTCIFMVIYYFFTVYYHGKPFYVFKIIKSSIPLIISFVVGILIAGILLIPGFMFILQNERIGANTFMFVYDIKVYLGLIFNYIAAPLTLFSRYGYMFYADATGHLSWYSIYTGAICAPIIFSLFKNEERNHKDRALYVFYIAMILCVSIPLVNSIFHGFSGSSMRWMFLITILNSLYASIYLTHIENKAQKILSGFFNYIIVFIISFVILFLLKIFNYQEYIQHLSTIIISFSILMIYLYLIKKGMYKHIYILTIVEVSLMMSVHMYILNSTYYKYNPSLNKDIITYNRNNDEDKFYRMYVDPNELMPSSTLNLNQSIKMNFYTTTSYDTTTEPSLKYFNTLNGNNWHIININQPEVLRMLGVKYYLVTDENNLPEGFNFTYHTNINHFMVYKLEEYRPIGFTYSKFKDDIKIEYDKNNAVITKNDLNWNDELLVEEDLKNLISDIKPSDSIDFELLEFYSDNHLYGHIYNEEKQVLYFSIPYSDGWRVYDNEVRLDTYKVQGGFIGVLLEPKDHYLTLQFTPPGFKYGAYSTIIGLACLLCIIIYDLKAKERSIKLD